MIVYDGVKTDFLTCVENDTIALTIENNIYTKMKRHTAKNEFRSWENSLEYMYKVLNDKDIPDDSGIAIEYNIPQTSKRVDFIVTGYDKNENPNVIIIELKQWDKIEPVLEKDAMVETYTGNAVREVVHPSYQAWSYSMLIRDYNQSVQDNHIEIHPCAYLHNYRRTDNDPLDNSHYQTYLEEAPAFTRGEVSKLRDFIKKSVVTGDNKEVLYLVDRGKIRPSKSLQNSIASMLKGNQEFVMLDEQKVVYENIMKLSKQSCKDNKKRTIIVQGGPGTGKTVVAINLLADLTGDGQCWRPTRPPFCPCPKSSAPRPRKFTGSCVRTSWWTLTMPVPSASATAGKTRLAR